MNPGGKSRIDQLLVKKGLYATRARAQAALISGEVFVNGERVTKAGTMVRDESEIEVRGEKLRYVSRGGLKLERALEVFRVSVEGRTALDIGASTGGFTDCLLQRGALKVYAVDVGYGQLAWKLRKDERVVVIERVNARNLKPEELYAENEGKASLAVIDVSFISLSKIFPAVYNLLSEDGEVIALVKPQFEAGRKQVEKGGLVRDEKVQVEVLERVAGSAGGSGFKVLGATFSPVRGADGNMEFLMHLAKSGEAAGFKAGEIVDRARRAL